MHDRLAAVIEFKAEREERAARDLAEALGIEQQQRALVEEQRQKLAADRGDVQLAWLADLAEARGRDVLKSSEQRLHAVERVVEDVRARHRQAAAEHQALVRVAERRRAEARREADRKEQRAFDEIAARTH